MWLPKTISKLSIPPIHLVVFLFFSQNIDSQGLQLTSGNASLLDRETRNYLYENDVRKKYIFEDTITDRTSYPYLETNISLLLGDYSFQAVNREGIRISYSKRGEIGQFHECKGDVCLLLTDRNILAISNVASEWSKTSFFSEERFMTKLGNRAAFVVTERAVYIFNGYFNEWSRIGLESEVVTAVSNKNELGLIVTSKRVFFLQLPQGSVTEISVSAKPIRRYEIRANTIECMSYDRVFQFDSRQELVTEMRTDR